ncbi:MAG: hypothetical protein LBF78_08635 [Treponema sp.]|jgi:hypothetical protein|nr:hypothetical protein [Treponema sp.]
MNAKRDLLKALALFVLVIIALNACITNGAAPSADQTAQYEQAILELFKNLSF